MCVYWSISLKFRTPSFTMIQFQLAAICSLFMCRSNMFSPFKNNMCFFLTWSRGLTTSGHHGTALPYKVHMGLIPRFVSLQCFLKSKMEEVPDAIVVTYCMSQEVTMLCIYYICSYHLVYIYIHWTTIGIHVHVIFIFVFAGLFCLREVAFKNSTVPGGPNWSSEAWGDTKAAAISRSLGGSSSGLGPRSTIERGMLQDAKKNWWNQ